MKELSYEEAQKFMDDRCVFLDYKSILEYIEDIVVCLIYSPWHYTEEDARRQCEERMKWIEYYYERKMPADDCAVDIGYNCG